MLVSPRLNGTAGHPRRCRPGRQRPRARRAPQGRTVMGRLKFEGGLRWVRGDLWDAGSAHAAEVQALRAQLLARTSSNFLLRIFCFHRAPRLWTKLHHFRDMQRAAQPKGETVLIPDPWLCCGLAWTMSTWPGNMPAACNQSHNEHSCI